MLATKVSFLPLTSITVSWKGGQLGQMRPPAQLLLATLPKIREGSSPVELIESMSCILLTGLGLLHYGITQNGAFTALETGLTTEYCFFSSYDHAVSLIDPA